MTGHARKMLPSSTAKSPLAVAYHQNTSVIYWNQYASNASTIHGYSLLTQKAFRLHGEKVKFKLASLPAIIKGRMSDKHGTFFGCWSFVFTLAYSLIIARILYALPAWGGFITSEPEHRVNAFLDALNSMDI